jgi:HK97 gp10 family phage protein
MADGMVLSGFEGLDRKLKALGDKIGKDITRKATRAAANNTLKQVKANAKSMIGGNMGGLIAKHAKVIVFKHQRKGSYGVQIGMKANVPQFDYWPVGSSSNLANRKSAGKKSYIPAAIEYGHGNARPIPYIRAAWNATKRRDVKIMRNLMKLGIEREARRG